MKRVDGFFPNDLRFWYDNFGDLEGSRYLCSILEEHIQDPIENELFSWEILDELRSPSLPHPVFPPRRDV